MTINKFFGDQDAMNKPSNGNIFLAKIDKKRILTSTGIQNLSIYSTFARVNVVITDSPNINIHLYGKVKTNVNVTFSCKVVDNELIIKQNSSKEDSSVGDLILTVAVPRKRFDRIAITTMSSNTTVYSGIICKTLTFKSLYGNLKTSSSFEKSSANTKNGNIDYFISPKGEVFLDLYTLSGNIILDFCSNASAVITTKTMSGKVINRYKGKSRDNVVHGTVETKTGSILIM